MRFSKALPLLFTALKNQNIDYALIGGLALYTLGTSRSTFDADFMMFLKQAEEVKTIMGKLGYKLLQGTRDVANYVSADPDMGQVDFLFAHRHYALEMMARAKSATLLGYPVKVLSAEDLIGLKIQASSNDPGRCAKDQSDIEDIVRQPRMDLDWKRIEEYYRIFNRESEFQNLRERFQ